MAGPLPFFFLYLCACANGAGLVSPHPFSDASPQAVEETTEEVRVADERLRAYEAVGFGFGDLVGQYSAILEDIANKKWALDELRNDDRFAFAVGDA